MGRKCQIHHMRVDISFFSLLLLLFFSGNLFAQHSTCDGSRYLTPVFPTLDSTKNLQFGANDNAWGFNTDLFMDVYEPAGDTAAQRPAIVFAFGEGFLGGDREDVTAICRSFANHGFVVANIDYRKYPGFFFTDSSQTVDAAIKGTQDMKAAVRYLREDAATANLFRIDPNYIFAGGISSGAISACYTAYMDTNDAVSPVIQTLLDDNGGLEGTSNNLQRSSAVQGVINWSGGLKDDEMMDAGDAPIFSAHETGDDIVPYGSGTVTAGLGVTIFFEGSATLKLRADALGIWNDLYTINANDHAGYISNPTHFLAAFQGALGMMHEVLCPTPNGVIAQPAAPAFQFYPQPAADHLTLEWNTPKEWTHFQLFDVMGTRLYEQALTGTRARIATEHLQNGVYIARMTGQSGQIVSQKISIQR